MGFANRGMSRFFGDRQFYRNVVTLVLPLVLQQTIASVVNLLDNVMVGGLGTEAISAVAIVSQIVFVYNLMLFGSMSGASIFSAQYVGARDDEGVRNTFRYKLLFGLAILCAAVAVIYSIGDKIILLYINDADGGVTSVAAVTSLAERYLRIIVWSLPPFLISQCLGSTLRENGQARAPMIASTAAIVVNLAGNWLLIYGKLGFPELGVEGAAIATSASRYVETAILIVYCFRARDEYPFLRGLVKTLRIPFALVKRIFITGAPLFVNETLWSLSMAAMVQCYSVRGLQTTAAVNIESTIWQLFAVGMFSMGTAISVLVGQRLGAGDMEGARDTDRKLLCLTVLINVGFGVLLAAASWLIPRAYNVEPEVRALATRLLLVSASMLPLNAIVQGIYFTIRSGGRTLITMLYDSVFCWLVQYPVAYLLVHYTELPVVWIYLAVRAVIGVKLFIAAPLLKNGTWARKIVQ